MGPFRPDRSKLDKNRVNFWEYAPHWNIDWQMNDQLAIGPPNLMKKYCSVFSEMLFNIFYNPEYRDGNDDIFINETLILQHINNKHIPLKPMYHGFEGSRGIDCGCHIMR